MKPEIINALEMLKKNDVSISEIESYLKTEAEPETKWFVYGIGIEGVEGILDLRKEINSLFSFQLRCRFNSQRKIKLYIIKTTMNKNTLLSELEKNNELIIKKSIEIKY